MLRIVADDDYKGMAGMLQFRNKDCSLSDSHHQDRFLAGSTNLQLQSDFTTTATMAPTSDPKSTSLNRAPWETDIQRFETEWDQ